MNKFKLGLAAFAALLVGVLVLKSCTKKPEPVLTGPLPSQDVLRVGIDNRRITVQTRSQTETQYVPDGAKATIEVDEEGDVSFDVTDAGFLFRPVLGIIVTDKLDVGLGAQLAYWKRFEGYLGVAVPHWAVYGAVGYRLDQIHLENTSIAFVATSRGYMGGAVFLRF